MTVTLNELIDHAEYAAPNGIDPRIDDVSIVNEAGRYLFGMHGWKWRNRPPASLDLTKDQGYVNLPSDFGEGDVIHLTVEDSVGFGAELTTLDHLEELRALTVDSPSFYYMALAYPTQPDTSSPAPDARLEVYPTPSATNTGAVVVVYRAGWVELSGGEDAANIPQAFDDLLKELVIAFVRKKMLRDYDTQEAIERSTWLDRLKRADASSQANLGPMRGGMLQADPRSDRRYDTFWTVNHPS